MMQQTNACVFVLLLCGISLQQLRAQEIPDSSIQLPEATVLAEPLRANLAGQRSLRLPTEELENFSHLSLADALTQLGGIYIKSYGNGSLATSSIRGGSAGHTSVLWNGIPVSSPMLGLLDLALLPITFADEVSLHYGGASAAWGSGAIGGVLSLNNSAPGPALYGISMQGSTGSFGFRDAQVNARYGQGRWSGKTRFFQRQARNDFAYRIRTDLPERIQQHAALSQTGLMQELYFQPNAKHQLALHLWYQEAARQIPPTTTQTVSEAEQDDAFLRTALHWKRTGTWRWQAKTAYFRELNAYRDPRQATDTKNQFETLLAELETNRVISGGGKLHFGVHGMQVQASTEAYDDRQTQQRLAVFSAFKQPFSKGAVQLNLRQEWVDLQALPLMPALGIEWQPVKQLSLRSNVSRNYRLPTLNDLYWQPGGNPGLRPEQGWSQELGLSTYRSSGASTLEYSITGFNRVIEDWIFWSVQTGNAFWSPQNITQVWSRGVEQKLELKRALGQVQLTGILQYDYIRSTSSRAIQFPKLEAGQQLFYTPVHQGGATLRIHFQRLQCSYQHQLVGAVTNLSQSTMEAFQLGHINLSWSWKHSVWGGRVFVACQNLWAADYRVIERQPMPGRQWQVGMRLHWQPRQQSDF